MNRRVFAAACAVAAGLAGAPAAGAWTLFPPQPTVGKPAPDFTATLFSGGKVSLGDYRGQVLVVNVWATWCTPCKRELPLLDAFYKVTRPYGLRIIAVTTEDSVPDNQLKPLAAVLSIPLAHRVRGPYGDLGGVPTNYVIDRAGVVRYADAGAFDLDKLNKVLIPLLREAPPTEAAPANASTTAPTTVAASPPKSLP